MSEARRLRRVHKRANIQHNPTLKKIVMDLIIYLDTTDDETEAVQKKVDEANAKWLSYCGKHKTANKDAFVENIYRFMNAKDTSTWSGSPTKK